MKFLCSILLPLKPFLELVLFTRFESSKKAVFKNLAILSGKHLYWSLFLKRLQAGRPTHYTRQVFSCEYSETFKENLSTVASITGDVRLREAYSEPRR